MKGAGRSGKPDDISTTASATSEARSEARDRSGRGLSRCLWLLSRSFLRTSSHWICLHCQFAEQYSGSTLSVKPVEF